MASRATQPYRKGRPRQPGGALTAMMRGSTFSGHNPRDAMRAVQRLARKRKSPTRPRRRSPRPPRLVRPRG
jgi:hypothetical protein